MAENMKETCFHRPLVPPEVPLKAGFEAQSSQRRMFLWRIGRYRFPIRSPAFGQKLDQQGWKLFVCPAKAGQTKKVFSVTSVPVVKANETVRYENSPPLC